MAVEQCADGAVVGVTDGKGAAGVGWQHGLHPSCGCFLPAPVVFVLQLVVGNCQGHQNLDPKFGCAKGGIPSPRTAIIAIQLSVHAATSKREATPATLLCSFLVYFSCFLPFFATSGRHWPASARCRQTAHPQHLPTIHTAARSPNICPCGDHRCCSRRRCPGRAAIPFGSAASA